MSNIRGSFVDRNGIPTLV